MIGRADKGIIITTGTFTTKARREADRDGAPPVELVDGEKLVEMFERAKLGLKPRTVYELDHAFFAGFLTDGVQRNARASRMHKDEEERLIEKLRKIEALFARATNAGERAAAESARDRIRERIEQLERSERAVEFRFSLPDAWSKSLFIALLRRYGIKPYRYSGQRRTTVMARVTRTFADEVLWPEYQQLNATLRAHLESVTKRVIAQAIHGDQADAEERPGQEPKARSPQGFLTAE